MLLKGNGRKCDTKVSFRTHRCCVSDLYEDWSSSVNLVSHDQSQVDLKYNNLIIFHVFFVLELIFKTCSPYKSLWSRYHQNIILIKSSDFINRFQVR